MWVVKKVVKKVAKKVDLSVALTVVDRSPCLLEDLVDLCGVGGDAPRRVCQEADGFSRAAAQLGEGAPQAPLLVAEHVSYFPGPVPPFRFPFPGG